MQPQEPVSPNAEAAAASPEAFIAAGHTAEKSTVVQTTPEEKAAGDRAAQADAARTRASQLMSERRYADAKKALEEADALDAPPVIEAGDSGYAPRRVLTALRSRLQRVKPAGAEASMADAAPAAEASASDAPVSTTAAVPVEKAVRVVDLYSKIAIAVGLLPGGILNFAGILALQVTMVWRIATIFGHKEGKEKIRGSILSLVGSVLPGTVGHGLGFAIASIPAVVTGTVVSFVATPALAYVLTQAVGNAFIMHFESGGTLLTFDPKAFREYLVKQLHRSDAAMKAA